jgi:hypothetical protein
MDLNIETEYLKKSTSCMSQERANVFMTDVFKQGF